MKKALLVLALGLVFSYAHVTYAASCADIDGASIYAHNPLAIDGSSWKFIGSVTNEYDSDSIANEYGDYGSKYSSDSIMDEYGDYGSKYSSESAFDKYASDPPVLVTATRQWAYLTVNSYMSPHISPYLALYCAQNGL